LTIRHIFLASPCGIEPQPASTTISGANAAPLGALVVAQSAAHPAPAHFDSTREPSSYQYFEVRLHISSSNRLPRKGLASFCHQVLSSLILQVRGDSLLDGVVMSVGIPAVVWAVAQFHRWKEKRSYA
jgi:hypothetical protein